MEANDAALFGDRESAARIAAKFAAMDAGKFLRLVVEDLYPGKVALVSSFGAESAVLLHMIAQIDKSTPVLFIDTGVLFPETLAYKDVLIARLGLRNVVAVSPDKDDLAQKDPENFLWASDPDRCCEIRKVAPLAKALEDYECWITGRKRFQAQTRSALAMFEAEGDRMKINPLAHWSAADLLAYLDANDLPRHKLVAKGYPSIGCIPCTAPVRPGEDARAGRWRGRSKVECGLHTQRFAASSLSATAEV